MTEEGSDVLAGRVLSQAKASHHRRHRILTGNAPDDHQPAAADDEESIVIPSVTLVAKNTANNSNGTTASGGSDSSLRPGDILVVRLLLLRGHHLAAITADCPHRLLFPLQMRLKMESGYPDTVRAVEISVGAVRETPPPFCPSLDLSAHTY